MEFIERAGTRVICTLYKAMNGAIFRGKNVTLYGCPVLRGRKNIVIGKGCTINPKVFIHGNGGVLIGDYVTISYGATILSTSLDVEHWGQLKNKKEKAHVVGSVKIGDNVWIGANVTILKNVEIASDCIIAAGAVVTRSLLEKECVYAGVPAKKIKRITIEGD